MVHRHYVQSTAGSDDDSRLALIEQEEVVMRHLNHFALIQVNIEGHERRRFQRVFDFSQGHGDCLALDLQAVNEFSWERARTFLLA